MSGSRVMITGVTGFIGFRILLEVLRAGYAAKAVVRSFAKSDAIAQLPLLQPYHADGRLEFVEVPDFSIPDAWNDVLKGINFIIHTASPLPLPTLDPEQDIYQPSVRGSNSLLTAALAAAELKRVILTSSIVGTMPLPPRGSGPYSAETSAATPTGPFADVNNAYQASKIHLLNNSRELVSKHKPGFDIINIFPGYTFGRNEMASSAQSMFTSSNAVLLMLLKGKESSVSRVAGAAHLDDVAQVHVKALDANIGGNRGYGISVPMHFEEAIGISRKHFAGAFADGLLVPGTQPSEVVEWDATMTERIFGMQFKGYETMVVDVVSQYLSFVRAEQARGS